MNFFEHQERARTRTRALVVIFALAIALVVLAVDALVLALSTLGQWQLHPVLPAAADSPRHLPLLLITSAATLALIWIAALVRTARLRAGGAQVVRELGGVEVGADPQDPERRRLRNLVEEMALAAGVPVPEVFVLEREPGINALAAGYTTADAAVAVTRGALDKLSRDQLQGVLAHEMSHIVNGDTRIDIRLMGALYGILAIALIGRHLRGVGGSRGKTGSVALLGIALSIIGSLGLLAARLVKAALARQREYLADASAVQFTRNPEGIGGALRRIAAEPGGAWLMVDTEEVSHMTFGEGTQTRLLASHPPLEERIRRIDPRFHPAQIQALATRLARARAGAAQGARPPAPGPAAPVGSAGPLAGPAEAALDPAGLIAAIGHPGQAQLIAAALITAALPDGLLAAARSPEWAPALLCLLLLDPNPEVREAQRLVVARSLGAEAEQRLGHLIAEHRTPDPRQRLPLAEIAFPALKRRPLADLKRLDQTIAALVAADGRLEVFEYALGLLLRVQIADALDPPRSAGRRELADLEGQARDLIGALAQIGQRDEPARRAAEAAGLSRAGWAPTQGTSLREDWHEALEPSLGPLDSLRPSAKGTLVAALVATVTHDQQVTVAEAEALRAICAALHVPLPMVPMGASAPR